MPANWKAHSVKRRPLRVLLVEDSEADAELLIRALRRGNFEPTWERLDSREEMERWLERREWDLILADHSMPGFSAPEALELMQARSLDIPFIIVSGHIDEETAIDAMRTGAHDYIMKDRLARLVPAVERELREAEMRSDLRRAHDELELRVGQRTSDLRAANLKLQSVLEERRRLETELLEIAENERRRIGFDLHDDLGQKLTGLSMLAKALQQRLEVDRHVMAEEARKIQELIDQAIHHTHDLAHSVSSLDVSNEDLVAALKDLAGKVKQMFGVPCALTAKGTIPEMPQHVALQLYKIAQEAISNAVKHGKATHVAIILARHDDLLALTIKNDGKPFAQPAEPTKRMGLRIMNYRANLLGASLAIEANRSGTTVCCTLPVKSNRKADSRSSFVDEDVDEAEPVASR